MNNEMSKALVSAGSGNRKLIILAVILLAQQLIDKLL